MVRKRQMKTTLITGPTSGIGLETARALAKFGMNLILVARDQIKLEAISAELKALNPQINVKYYLCDFSNLEQTSKVAELIANENPKIDILINNAGTWFNKMQLNVDGLEYTWVVNYFSMFIFTQKLLPNLKIQASKTKDVRILILGSEGHRFGEIDFAKFDKFHFQKTYGSTKLADMMLSFKLARLLSNTGITVNTIHPGVIATELWRKLPRPIAWIMSRVLASPREGAETSIYLATLEELNTTGKYWAKSKIKEPAVAALDESMQDRLYDWTLEKMKRYL